MADTGELMLEILKSLQTGQIEIKDEVRRLSQRFNAFERHQAADKMDFVSFREEVYDLKIRLERIERRLELHDPRH